MNTTDTAIILAGGRSLRMGFDKQLLKLNDKYLLEKNLNILLGIFSQVLIVSNDPKSLLEIPHIEQTRILQDKLESGGPLAGIHAGLRESKADYAFVLAVDMPVLDEDYIRRMKEQMSQAKSTDGLINVSRSTGEPEPFCAFYGRHLVPQIESFIKGSRRSLRHFIDQHDFLRLTYPDQETGQDIFLNLNDKKELRRYHEKTEPLVKQLSEMDRAVAPPIRSMPVLRYKAGVGADVEDDVITEAEVQLYLNDEFFQTMYCTPSHLDELITGNLYAQGRITKPDDVEELAISQSGERDLIQLEIRAKIKPFQDPEQTARSTARIISTSGTARPAIPFKGSLQKPDADLTLDIARISAISAAFQDTSSLFARTGGNHACALIKDNEMISFMEDIGRHNALDKLIGRALLSGTDLTRCMILLSGRMASEMTMKVLRTPVTALLSRAAPTDRSIRLAKENNMTMMGFIRGDRLNIYHKNNGHILK